LDLFPGKEEIRESKRVAGRSGKEAAGPKGDQVESAAICVLDMGSDSVAMTRREEQNGRLRAHDHGESRRDDDDNGDGDDDDPGSFLDAERFS
jgi:hypothetical protein